MTFTRTSFIRLIRYSIAAVVIILIIAYAIWRSLDYARGPKITIFEPTDGSSIAATTTVIRGRAERINSLTLNGNTISVDEQGNFKQTIIIFRGINIITMTARDQFGRDAETDLHIVGLTGQKM